jgi:hypothetical protein
MMKPTTRTMTMSTVQLHDTIKQLPLREQILLAEWILSHAAKPDQISLAEAAAQMLDEYQTESELTAFTVLDSEDIYEAR